ncbi:MAG: GNAT family N-acetyltransferase [Clostridia bacterium]|nr:GNAT family N-acetyltransferase [Clostridia bacterium]
MKKNEGVELGVRTRESVAEYFAKAQSPEIKKYLPQRAETLAEALEDYEKTLLPDADSYGRTVWTGGRYVGDVWCYCMDAGGEPQAMVSYCILDAADRGRGYAAEALRLFIRELADKFGISVLGAFTYAENLPSRAVLEKCGFKEEERFTEDGRESCYYRREE